MSTRILNWRYIAAVRFTALPLVLTAVMACSSGSSNATSESPSPTLGSSSASSPVTTSAPAAATAETSGQSGQPEVIFPAAKPEDVEAILADLPNVVPPTQGEGSYGAFQVERIEWYAQCLEESGIAVEIVDFGVTYRIPEGQELVYAEIKEDCRSLTRERFGMPDHPSPEILETWYKAYLWTWQCLIDHGYELGYPPTVDSFVESGGSNWQPYFELVSSGAAPLGDARFELESACPQDPEYLVQFLGL